MKLDVLFHIIFYSDFVLFSKLISHIHKKLHGCDTINLQYFGNEAFTPFIESTLPIFYFQRIEAPLNSNCN